MDLPYELSQIISGEVKEDADTLGKFSHDASIFEVIPEVVVSPKNVEDIEKLVQFVAGHKKADTRLSLTARAAGTDMSGGAVNDSIIVSFAHFNRLKSIAGDIATVEPGMYYHDFEKKTLDHGLLFPPYPSSREICAIGGMIGNNCGGEKSLAWGKAQNYVVGLSVVLADGHEYFFEALDEKGLVKKMRQKDFEGDIYRKIYKLIDGNYDLITKAKPNASKNSSGYFLWDVWDREKKIFDLTKLFVGSQGTLGLITRAELKLEPVQKYSEMVIVFMNSLDHLGQIINDVLPLKPESFETYDDHTFKLAIKYFSSFSKKLGSKNIIDTFLHFAPEFLMMLTRGVPKLVLQVEFAGENREELKNKVAELVKKLAPYNPEKIKVAPSKRTEKKYWLIRRESFNLLRQRVKGMHASPFIDDFAIRPEYLPEFLPKLNKIFAKYPHLIYTLAGHIGDGNFHIIPLMDLKDEKQRESIPALCDEVFGLVHQYKGTMSGEHNDGLIRTPYVEKMYGEKIYKLFEETKKIFDPQGIFNPRKKVGGDLKFAMEHIRTD